MEDKTTDQQVYKYTMYIYQHLLVSRDNWDIIPQKAQVSVIRLISQAEATDLLSED